MPHQISSAVSPLVPARPGADWANPRPSLLARLLESRLAAERGQAPAVDQTHGPRPHLPAVSGAAAVLYAQRRHVDSYPLLFTTLALAHPN